RLLMPQLSKRSGSLMYQPRSKFFTSAAKVVGNRRASKWPIGATPLLPSSCDSYRSFTLWPSGVIAPMPVMTTRLLISRIQKSEVRSQKSEEAGFASGFWLLVFSKDYRAALAHLGETDLEHVGTSHRPRGAGDHGHRAIRVGLFIVQCRRHLAVLERQQAGRQFRRDAA